jgi:hypothetical protein
LSLFVCFFHFFDLPLFVLCFVSEFHTAYKLDTGLEPLKPGHDFPVSGVAREQSFAQQTSHRAATPRIHCSCIAVPADTDMALI